MKSCAVLLVAVGLLCLFQPSEAWPLKDANKLKANWLCQYIFNRNSSDAIIDDKDKAEFEGLPLLKNSDNFNMLWTSMNIAVGSNQMFDGEEGINFLNGIYYHGNDFERIFEVVFFYRA